MKLLRTCTLPLLRTRLPSIEPALGEHRDAEGLERKRLYKTAAWLRLRAAQLKRQPWCACGARANTVDHVHGHADEHWRARFFDPTMLQSMCASCHSLKTSTIEQVGAGGLRRPAVRAPSLPRRSQEQRAVLGASTPLPPMRSPSTRGPGLAGAADRGGEPACRGGESTAGARGCGPGPSVQREKKIPGKKGPHTDAEG